MKYCSRSVFSICYDTDEKANRRPDRTSCTVGCGDVDLNRSSRGFIGFAILRRVGQSLSLASRERFGDVPVLGGKQVAGGL